MEKGTTTGIIMVIVFIIGLGIGYFLGNGTTNTIPATTNTVENTTNEDVTDEQTQTSASEEIPEEGVTIDGSQLSDGQRQLLNTLGIDADNITLTPAMIACAEAKVGSARLEEIQGGATPSFMEGASLVACYR